MINRFVECGLGPRDLLPKRGKTLHWNVDFLLDLQSAEIINIFAIRSSERLEYKIARQLEHNPHTEVIEPGLGANDAPCNTHLLRLNADEMWWVSFTEDIQTYRLG